MGAHKQALRYLKNSLKIITQYIEKQTEEEEIKKGKIILPDLLLSLSKCYIKMKMYKIAHTCLKQCQSVSEELHGEDHESGFEF